jgi:hypothetical protein
MKWLTLDWIKQHSRLDFNCEDESERELMILYGEDAEQTVLNICNRTLEDIIEQYGKVPAPLYVAALQLVEVNYINRSPNSMQNMYQVKYSFDMKIKPYMKLT